MMERIANFLGGNVLRGVNSVVKTVFGSKEARDAADAGHTTEFLRAVANEALPRQNRTWWDGLVDGINRLVRPTYTFGIIAIFYLAFHDPALFAVGMQAIQLIPDELWYLQGIVIGFWFTGKAVTMIRRPKPLDPKAVAAVIKAKKEYEDSRPQAAPVEPPASPEELDRVRRRLREQDND